MSSVNIKTLLKEAREAIKNKDFPGALKLCKTILKDDKENYMALVFLGISLQETGLSDQAPNAFRKAIHINPNNILAWNGLANYYEKTKSETELIEVYTSLLELETNEQRLLELCRKVSSLPSAHENLKLFDAMEKVLKVADISQDTISTVWISIANLLSKWNKLPISLLNLYEKALAVILGNSTLITRQYYSEYLKILYEQKKYSELFQEAKKMYSLYTTDLTPVEWMCKIYTELTIEGVSLAVDYTEEIEFYNSILLNIQNDSVIGLFTKSVISYNSKNYEESRSILKQVTALKPNLLHAWVLLAFCNFKLYMYNEAAETALKGEELLKCTDNPNQDLRKQLDLLLMEILSRNLDNDYLKMGTDKCLELLSKDQTDSNALKCLIRCYINQNDYSQAKVYLAKLSKRLDLHSDFLLLNVQLLHKQGNLLEAVKLLENEIDVDVSEWWYELGLLYWELKDYEKCLVPLLKAAKLAPTCYLYFLQLGHYYQQFGQTDKAKRCYEKAFTLNRKSIEAAVELNKLYKTQKNWDSNLTLLKDLTGGIVDTSNRWAWLQLGLNYLAQEDYVRAIETLQYVVRMNADDSHCWESLADAYMARGAYTSAMKSYQKAAELTTNSLYPALQVANIKQALGEYTEAKAAFEDILITNKSYVLALKGIAETCINLAYQHKNNQLLGNARSCAQYALDMLTIALQQRNDLSCLWKLAGDSCFLVATLPERFCCLLVLATFSDGKVSEGNKVLEQQELYMLAERCYYKSLSLIEDKVLMWHDLANCFMSHALACSDLEKANQLFKKANTIIRHCVSVNPTKWQHWNLMGVLCIRAEPKNYAWAQHCFINAVKAENNSAIAWCNLGTLYFILGDLKLANQSFSQAQRADPNYINSWIGQALIAENLGMDDAMDLFRHSTQLGFHEQGAVGYGHWVCQTLLKIPPGTILYSIHNMHAIPMACDHLTWYTEIHPEDACAWNMLGLLRERMGLKSSTTRAFRNAVRLCSKDHSDKARTNYGRLLFKEEKYSQAVCVYKDVEQATFNSGSGLALSLFKDQQYEESYETYEQALHWLTDEQVLQSDLLVALACIAYMFQGPDSAKTLLFQSTQLKPSSPYGLYATLVLGLRHKDFKLATLVLQELGNLRDKPECIPHYGDLLSYFYLSQKQEKAAVSELSKLIHRHPNYASLWLTISVLLIQVHKEKPSAIQTAARCAERGVKLGRTNMDVTKVLHVIFLAFYLTKNYKDALKAAQKAVHCYPNTAESWISLIAIMQLFKEKFDRLLLQKFADHIQTNLNPTSTLLEWLQLKKLLQ